VDVNDWRRKGGGSGKVAKKAGRKPITIASQATTAFSTKKVRSWGWVNAKANCFGSICAFDLTIITRFVTARTE